MVRTGSAVQKFEMALSVMVFSNVNLCCLVKFKEKMAVNSSSEG